MQEQLSRRQVWVPIIMDVLLTNFKGVTSGWIDKLNWLSMPITLLNSQNNRRAFSRG
ncbi:MAG: hypothetical protein JKY14_02760 [Paraglaciecola sp.]|nr:hypothetical protein [Paraglaciecola sp.]